MSFLKWLFITISAFLLVACGSGGGNSSRGGASQPPTNVTGAVMLGPVRNIRVTVTGTSGVLGNSVFTSSDGIFGPITIPGNYRGPLLVEAVPEANTTFICDGPDGCPDGAGGIVAFSNEVSLSEPLRLYLANPTQSGTNITLSALSTAAAARTDALGGLQTGAIEQANQEMDSLIAQVLDAFVSGGTITLDQPYYAYPIIDLTAPPSAPTDATEARVGALLALLSSGLFKSGPAQTVPNRSAEAFLQQMSKGFADNGNLPLASSDHSVTSLENVFLGGANQLIHFDLSPPADVSGVEALLAPLTFNDVRTGLLATLTSFPAIVTDPVEIGEDDLIINVSDETLGDAPTASVHLSTTDGVSLSVDQLSVITLHDWLMIDLRDGGESAILDITLVPNRVEELGNGTFVAEIVVTATDGSHRSLLLAIDVHSTISGLAANAGGDLTVNERASVDLQGSSNRPHLTTRFAWTQTAGTPVSLVNPDQANVSFIAPSVTSDEILSFELTVTDALGNTATNTVNVNVKAFPIVADLSLTDTGLADCINAEANVSNPEDAGAVTSLNCSSSPVRNLAGIEVFANLTTLNLSGSRFGSLAPLFDLNALTSLDLRGNPYLLCTEISTLKSNHAQLVITDDGDCNTQVTVNLGAAGFDAVVDANEERLFVSLPERGEVAVISMETYRVTNRVALLGQPRGMSLSLDATRLFVALDEANQVGVINLSDLSVSTIGLGSEPGAAHTFDLVEAATDRLVVTTGDGNQLSYVVQVRLDQANAVSRIANDRIIRAFPVVAADAAHRFAYIGEGFSPNSLYKLDLTQPDAPIILDDDHGSVNGTDQLALNPAGDRIVLGSGQVLRTGSFAEEGTTIPGAVAASTTENLFFVAETSFSDSTGRVSGFDFTTLEPITTIDTGCTFDDETAKLVLTGNDSDFLMIQGATLCGVATVNADLIDPTPRLAVVDPVLDACIRDQAATAGITDPEDFTALDCSRFPGIQTLSGLEDFSNLVSLNVSDSGVFDLEPVVALRLLGTLELRNTAVANLEQLTNPNLTTLDVSGSPNVACAQLTDLRNRDIDVMHTGCLDTPRVELGGIGEEIVIDPARSQIYVSVPSHRQVMIINDTTFLRTGTFDLPDEPRGIALSIDGTTLFAALGTTGQIAYITIDTHAVELVDISAELGNMLTHDIVEVSQDRLIATANPGSSGFSYVVEIRRDLMNQQKRIADNTVIRAAPELEIDRSNQFVYIGAGFSPNSLYKLDASNTDLPIILEDDHGSVSGTNIYALSTDGSEVYLSSGQRLNTNDFTQSGLVPRSGALRPVNTDLLAVFSRETQAVEYFDTTTLRALGNRVTACETMRFQIVEDIEVASDGAVLVLVQDLLCRAPVFSQP